MLGDCSSEVILCWKRGTIMFWKDVSRVTQVRRTSETAEGRGVGELPEGRPVIFRFVPSAWVTAHSPLNEWFQIPERGASPRALNLCMHRCLHVSWEPRLPPQERGSGAIGGCPAGCKLCTGKPQGVPVSPGRGPARGRQAGGGEFLPV